MSNILKDPVILKEVTLDVIEYLPKPVYLSSILKNLKNHIQFSYEGQGLKGYREEWNSSLLKILNEENIEHVTGTFDWEEVYEGCVANFLKSKKTASNSTSKSASSKQQLLSEIDLNIIKTKFESLEKDKLWTLSTGTVVEEKMKELALKCTFEHPCHSFILDTTDTLWLEYFTKEEMNEIINYNASNLPPLSIETQNHFKQFQGIKSRDDLFRLFSKSSVDFSADSELAWILITIYNSYNLFYHRNPYTKNQSEAFFVHRVWSFVESAFDNSEIDCYTGEKSSTSSSNQLNTNRTISAETELDRKVMGRKIDWLFQAADLDFGCGEAARTDDSTKQLLDGAVKMPKVLKSILCSLCESIPFNKISVPGLLISKNAMTIKIMEAPVQYVTRLNTLPSFRYPASEKHIIPMLLPLMKQVLQVKIMMENNLSLFTTMQSEHPLTFTSPSTPVIPPCFHIQKKRKQN